MLSLAGWNRFWAAKIALELDEAAGLARDSMLILRLARLKNLALDSKTSNWGAWKVDRQTLAQTDGLKKSLRGGAEIWEIFRTLNEIENGLYDRERKKGEATPMEDKKRELFGKMRVQALEIDWLSARRQKLVDEGVANKGMNIELKREDFNAVSRRLRQTRAAFEQTRQALRAMDTVVLLKSEEAALVELDKYYAAMPSLEDLERMQVGMEMRAEDMNRRSEAVQRLDQELDNMFAGMTADKPDRQADAYWEQVRLQEQQAEKEPADAETEERTATL